MCMSVCVYGVHYGAVDADVDIKYFLYFLVDFFNWWIGCAIIYYICIYIYIYICMYMYICIYVSM